MLYESAEVVLNDQAGKEIARKAFQKRIFEKGEPLSDGTAPTPEALFAETMAYFQSLDAKTNPLITILSHVTRSYDLAVRAGIRNELTKANAGPDAALAKAAKNLLPFLPAGTTIEDAIAKLKTQLA